MLKFFFLTFLTISSSACFITGTSTIILHNNGENFPLKSKGCSEKQISTFKNVLKESTGTLSSRHLKRIEGLSNISLNPSTIRVRKLEEIVQSRLNLSSSKKIEFIQQQFPSEFYSLENDEFLEVHCSNCSKSGVRNVKITKTNGIKRSVFWAKAKVLSSVKVFVAKNNIQLDFNGINNNDFEIKQIFVHNPNDVFSKDKKLPFFRLNKSITKGHVILSSDLTPIQLVRHGNPVKVSVRNSFLHMNLLATPLSSGKFGETIRLKNRKSKKIFFGKVIGLNKVKVEL